MTPVDSVVARLTALHPKLIDLSLERMWRILAALGHPERSLPPVIHVGGTNGKGSTIAFMRAILEAAGRRVHVYTSPHLVRFNERFRLGGEGEGRLASDEELGAALLECERAEHLGDSVGKIAAEKAGILKPGVPAIVAAQPREALAAIARQAARIKAPIRIAGEDWTATEERGRLVYQDDDGLLDLPAPKLYGRHQFENAGVAIAALRAVGALALPPAAFESGIAKADWPARMQRLAHGRLAALAPPGSELWLDGGHNADGGRAIANALADLEERVSRPVVLVVGMLSTKDCESFLKNFAGLTRRVVALPVPRQEKSLPADRIAEIARGAGIPAQASADVESALAAIARFDLEAPPRILITGSLYLAGDV